MCSCPPNLWGAGKVNSLLATIISEVESPTRKGRILHTIQTLMYQQRFPTRNATYRKVIAPATSTLLFPLDNVNVWLPVTRKHPWNKKASQQLASAFPVQMHRAWNRLLSNTVDKQGYLIVRASPLGIRWRMQMIPVPCPAPISVSLPFVSTKASAALNK